MGRDQHPQSLRVLSRGISLFPRRPPLQAHYPLTLLSCPKSLTHFVECLLWQVFW